VPAWPLFKEVRLQFSMTYTVADYERTIAELMSEPLLPDLSPLAVSGPVVLERSAPSQQLLHPDEPVDGTAVPATVLCRQGHPQPALGSELARELPRCARRHPKRGSTLPGGNSISTKARTSCWSELSSSVRLVATNLMTPTVSAPRRR
jgi:hypothetical protein